METWKFYCFYLKLSVIRMVIMDPDFTETVSPYPRPVNFMEDIVKYPCPFSVLVSVILNYTLQQFYVHYLMVLTLFGEILL